MPISVSDIECPECSPMKKRAVSDHEVRSTSGVDEEGDPYSILAEISFFLITSQSEFAGSFSFQRDYRYQAKNAGRKRSCRRRAMEKVEMIIIDDLCRYLQDEPALKYFELTRDQLRGLANKILQRKIVEEKWEGQSY